MTLQYSRPDRQTRECKYWWFDHWDRLVNSAIRCTGTPRVKLEEGEIAIDSHIHSLFSHCSVSQPQDIILRAVHLGLSGVCVMDHNDIRGSIDAAKCADYLKQEGLIPGEFLVIPGVEINSSLGHIGAMFVSENIPMGLGVEECVHAIHEAGGLAVAVHPYHSTGICDAIFDASFDAVEVECGSVFSEKLVRQNRELITNPKLAGYTKLGSSDAHYIQAIASCYTVVKPAQLTLDSVRAAITMGECTAKLSAPCRRLRHLLSPISKLR
ncbi:MAG: PHP domain-containing protein [Armatimonadota bacterium]|nr:PHP domain-containing protein [bacterium]